MKQRILFICHGNICRSTMAEFVMRKLANDHSLGDKLHIASAATSREELGHDTHPGTKAELKKQNIPFFPRQARQMTKADYDAYDMLIAMDRENLHGISRIMGRKNLDKVSLLLDHANRAGAEVADPWYTGNFSVTYQDVLEGCQGLLQELREKI